MTTDNSEFAAALAEIDAIFNFDNDDMRYDIDRKVWYPDGNISFATIETAKRALLLADKVTREPSEGIICKYMIHISGDTVTCERIIS